MKSWHTCCHLIDIGMLVISEGQYLSFDKQIKEENMKSIYSKFINFTLFAVVFSMALSVSAQRQPYRVTDNQVRTVITRIETRTDTFRRQIDRFENQNDSQFRDQVEAYVTEFENATDRLSSSFSSRRSTTDEVQEVLGRASVIDQFMRSNRINANAQSQWNLIRSDLNMLAGYYSVRFNWNTVPTYPNNTNSLPYNVNDTQLRAVITRIETRTNTLQTQINRWERRNTSQFRDQVAIYVNDFEGATDALRISVSSRRSTSVEVQEVLSRAVVIDRFMRDNRVNLNTQNQWELIRTDLNTLAGYYSVTWDWNNIPTTPTYPGNNNNFPRGFDARLTGTYRLNASLSDNVTSVLDRAVTTLGNNDNQRDRIRRNLERRMMSPETLVIEKRGQQITMASSISQQISFDADGVSRSETNQNGRTIQTSVVATNNELTISYEGDRMNDFNVVFMPMNNGQLRVTRRVYMENRNETVTVNSVYDKTDRIARWDNINMQTLPTDTYSNNNGNNNGNVNNDFIVTNNTRIIATLDTPLSTKTFRDGDRFSMTVTSPSQYQGAVIEGRVNGEKSGVVSGRANLTLDFDTIRLRNGSTYRFGGIVDQVREPDGDVVSVNNEGAVRDGNQTKKTVTRAGIGAALGAIIGAIAGGGSGAAIGAGVGAGAGAGSVVLQGRDNLELPSGTEFSVTATAPTNR